MDPKEFRIALGQFPTGVAIVTAIVEGQRLGSTISSFNSVSLEPPLVLFSLIKGSLGFSQWKAAAAFCIAVLGESQRDLSNRFAKAGSDKWAGIEPRFAENGAPMVPDAIVYFECEPYGIHDGGDHEIFVSRVTRFHVTEKPECSLIFYSGKYRQLNDPERISSPPVSDPWLHGW
ncbi:flavin reductase [Paraburkholderia dipogonis]|uniref:Flavin reductase n=1 Tax=Paraburkholderia dipogonis TaxID=1211383 RepID=A0A4Y8MKM5_9BURK|nr:flavin reductase [Paraburkholderia dipogonis]